MRDKRRFSEQFQLNDLDRHAVSDLTAEWLWDRQHNGIDDFSLKALKIDKANMLLTFTADPSRIVGHSVKNVSVDGNDVMKKGYASQLQFLDPEEFLGSSVDFNSFSHSEQKSLVKDYLDDGMARVHCTCPAYYYQGHFEAMASHDSDIYKFTGPRGSGKWRSKHSSGLSDNDITICKHLASIIEQIHSYDDDILAALLTYDWGGGTPTNVVVDDTPVAPREKDVEPVLDTALIRNTPEPEEIIEPPIEEELPEEEIIVPEEEIPEEALPAGYEKEEINNEFQED